MSKFWSFKDCTIGQGGVELSKGLHNALDGVQKGDRSNVSCSVVTLEH